MESSQSSRRNIKIKGKKYDKMYCELSLFIFNNIPFMHDVFFVIRLLLLYITPTREISQG